jgi:Thioesterase-like superfamily
MSDDTALFTRHGNSFLGNPCACGPWGPTALAGGAVLSLLGHVLEDVPSIVPMSLSRMTVDLMRPVPLDQKLTVESVVRRDGRKLQVVDLVVKAGDTEHALARVLRLRNEDIRPALGEIAPVANSALPVIPPPIEYQRLIPPGAGTGFIPRGIDFVRPPDHVDGPNTIWMRLRVAVVEGEETRPTSLAAVPMDVVNLIGYALDVRRATAINADVSSHITRYPVGEWVAITGNTHVDGPIGHGVSLGTLSDSAGVFGVTSMAQIVDPVQVR